MNAVEIEAAISELAASPFDADEFPWKFLEAFGNNATTLARLRKGATNKSDIPGGVLQQNNIHLAVAGESEVHALLLKLRESPKTVQARAKFIFATDGRWFEAEDLRTGEPVSGELGTLADHLGFFLPLAGITTVKEIKDNPIDVRATGRLNKLYVELLKENPDWATEARRPDLNHFLARLIFCFFAEDTDIFFGSGLFTKTVDQMSERDGSNTHVVLEQVFRAMNAKPTERDAANLPNYADQFPYVNGGLFSGSAETPKFSKIARSYLIRAGELNWREINPDIFGSMIQAVADDEERGSLGMHYTSVPNILKVLNPLFLDDLREQLERAGDHRPSLLKLRERMSRIRVFDPACGSGNFLVIAYKEMRAIEGEINRRRNEVDRASDIHLTNFRGIEIRDFAAEVARLALIIAEFQCDVLYRGRKLALAEFLPLDAENWIVCGNALRLDWKTVCPPFGATVGIIDTAIDLFDTPLDQPSIDFENEGGETYICGNPPYRGSQDQSKEQKGDLSAVFSLAGFSASSLDFVAGWFVKAALYGNQGTVTAAFVSTNSICQGRQVPILWKAIFSLGCRIKFAHLSFKWANLASHKAVVTVAIVGLTSARVRSPKIYSSDGGDVSNVREVDNINPYLVAGPNIMIEPRVAPASERTPMLFGNMPNDEGKLLCTIKEARDAVSTHGVPREFLRPFVGSKEFVNGTERWCIWVTDDTYESAKKIPWLKSRFDALKRIRLESKRQSTQALADRCHRFGEIRQVGDELPIIVPRHTSEDRQFLPVGPRPTGTIVGDSAFALLNAPLWNLSLIASRLHLVWIGTVCGKLKTDYRYSNTLGWNTFPIPTLTEQNKADLTRCAEVILLARERHFPKTIADLYDPENMPDDLRRAHELNDETLERIYIGRRFKNDTERLEKLFELYAKMVGSQPNTPEKKARKKATEQLEAFADA